TARLLDLLDDLEVGDEAGTVVAMKLDHTWSPSNRLLSQCSSFIAKATIDRARVVVKSEPGSKRDDVTAVPARAIYAAMHPDESRTDAELLKASAHDVEAFGRFYDRHAAAVAAFFVRRTGCPHLAADLTAETFAAAFVSRRCYRDTGPPALA